MCIVSYNYQAPYIRITALCFDTKTLTVNRQARDMTSLEISVIWWSCVNALW